MRIKLILFLFSFLIIAKSIADEIPIIVISAGKGAQSKSTVGSDVSIIDSNDLAKSNEYFVPISIENIDVEAEIKKLEVELKRAEGFLFGITKKLSNERFVSNAPSKVLELERKKESDTIAKIETIKSSLASLQ